MCASVQSITLDQQTSVCAHIIFFTIYIYTSVQSITLDRHTSVRAHILFFTMCASVQSIMLDRHTSVCAHIVFFFLHHHMCLLFVSTTLQVKMSHLCSCLNRASTSSGSVEREGLEPLRACSKWALLTTVAVMDSVKAANPAWKKTKRRMINPAWNKTKKCMMSKLLIQPGMWKTEHEKSWTE